MREWYYGNKIMVVLILVIIAFGIHSWAHKIDFVLLAETILFSLIAFVFFDWATDATAKKELFKNMSRMLRNHHDNTNLGFERVILNAEMIPYQQLIKESSEIYICQVYGRTWLTNHKRVLIDTLNKNPGVKVNFIIYAPSNPSIKSLANLFTSGNKDELKEKVKESIAICNEIYATSPDRVVIKEIDDIPFFGALYIFDKKAFQIPLSTSTASYANFIAYEFEDVPNDSSGYKVIKSQIDELLS